MFRSAYSSLRTTMTFGDAVLAGVYDVFTKQLNAKKPGISSSEETESIPDKAFSSDTTTDDQGNIWEYISYEDGKACMVVSLQPNTESVAIPAELDGFTVVAIGPEACMNQSVLREIFLPSSVRRIGNKAFAHNENLHIVNFSDGLEWIDDFAFMDTPIEVMQAPKSLKVIGSKAFFRCFNLSDVSLNEGLECLGDDAFAWTAVIELKIPATVSVIGSHILQAHGKDVELRIHIDEANPILLSDPAGESMYVRDGEGLTLLEYRGSGPTYTLLPQTKHIAPHAFVSNSTLKEIILPEGLISIGEEAFRSSRALQSVDIPDSVISIGSRAFLDTSIRSLHLPASLVELDPASLMVNEGFHSARPINPLSVEIDPENPRFYVQDGLVCECIGKGHDRALLQTGSNRVVRVPRAVKELGSNLFYGVGHIDELFIHDDIEPFDPQAFMVARPIEHVQIELRVPLDGHDHVDLYFSQENGGHLCFISAFKSGRFDIPWMMRMSNLSVRFISDQFLAGRLTTERLTNPFLLDEEGGKALRDMLGHNFKSICKRFAERHYVTGFQQLLNLGYIDEGNFDEIIEEARAIGSVAVAGYLMDAKRRAMGVSTFSEYDL